MIVVSKIHVDSYITLPLHRAWTSICAVLHVSVYPKIVSRSRFRARQETE